MKPWWLPDNWLIVIGAIVGIASFVQIWKVHCRHQYGRKPPRYRVAAISSGLTFLLLLTLGWLDEQPIKKALGVALVWGLNAPVVWLGIQQAVLQWAPWLAPAVGASRRESPRDGEVWTEAQRKGWLEDTVEIKRKQGGFGQMWLIMGIAGAALMAAVAVQSWRLSQAHEALGAERVAKTLALARIEALSAEKRAAEASLAHRDQAYALIRERKTEARRKLAEVEHDPESKDWLDRLVPDAVRMLVRGGGGHPGAKAVNEPASPDSGASGGGEAESRPHQVARGVGG